MLSADTVVDQAKKYSPHVASWWVVMIQGIVIGALGIYLVGNTEGARENAANFIALYLYSMGLSDMARHRFLPEAPGKGVAYLRALVAAIAGGICVVLLVFNFPFTASILQWIRWMLGAAMLIYGIAGLYLAFTVRERGSGRLLSTLAAAIFILLGVSVLFLHDRNVLGDWIGPALIALGIGLIGFSIYRFRQGRKTDEDAVVAAGGTAAAAVVASPEAGSSAAISDTTAGAPVVATTAGTAAPVSAIASTPDAPVAAPAPAPAPSSPSAAPSDTAGQSGV